jgi:hypothetical protein
MAKYLSTKTYGNDRGFPAVLDSGVARIVIAHCYTDTQSVLN